MPSHYPPQIKRAIRFSLGALLDPELTKAQRQAVKIYFDFACAFCGVDLRGVRGHMDHLVSIALGGENHISNRVLACAACNGDQKLDREWQEFLRCVCSDASVREQREERILAWMARHQPTARNISAAQRRVLTTQIEAVLNAYDHAVERLRAVRRGVG